MRMPARADGMVQFGRMTPPFRIVRRQAVQLGDRS
jgi:hypothetical protein